MADKLREKVQGLVDEAKEKGWNAKVYDDLRIALQDDTKDPEGQYPAYVGELDWNDFRDLIGVNGKLLKYARGLELRIERLESDQVLRQVTAPNRPYVTDPIITVSPTTNIKDGR